MVKRSQKVAKRVNSAFYCRKCSLGSSKGASKKLVRDTKKPKNLDLPHLTYYISLIQHNLQIYIARTLFPQCIKLLTLQLL